MNKPKSDTKVFVALSGGVDSATCAYLLKQEGYDLTGVFMKNWSGDEYGLQSECPWEQDQKDAEAVCKSLDIPFRSYNFEKQYRDAVVSYFFEEYSQGRTPNPDVMCNKEIKFKIFLERAIVDGADMIATGHYAQVRHNPETNLYELHKGIDGKKDQSYFLHQITQQQLSKTLFPIGHIEKQKVREIAKEANLPVATKKDSQGICFIGDINVKQFLRQRIRTHKGEIKDIETNTTIGQHDGIEFYTVGQREGLKLGGSDQPYFVCGKDYTNNIIFVAKGTDNKFLYDKTVKYTRPHWISEIPSERDLSAAIRYRHQPQFGELFLEDNSFEFNQPQRAIAPGQSIVFYDGNKCLGGAIIVENQPLQAQTSS